MRHTICKNTVALGDLPDSCKGVFNVRIGGVVHSAHALVHKLDFMLVNIFKHPEGLERPRAIVVSESPLPGGGGERECTRVPLEVKVLEEAL